MNIFSGLLSVSDTKLEIFWQGSGIFLNGAEDCVSLLSGHRVFIV